LLAYFAHERCEYAEKSVDLIPLQMPVGDAIPHSIPWIRPCRLPVAVPEVLPRWMIQKWIDTTVERDSA